ncbi:MAG: hypothetical protein B0D96_04335 [Candidatus Sedimenticola endophacoides]|uniref:EamA/RhaT family transporter n=2 Tax=Candidatus Sedimenticola endophacoides TaxID=2548426 RepID=A0A657PRY3_9GAMM|nr:MAG: hypothetical protein B0D94_02205 [Candidatus Sedimenticola endophacoides]OQX36383.1 MAG: hypothetical protein B0D96_04335 [Candidatus Sedimenticola endophacoides]OQX41471.1 MAG: hypothetical protein B0D89_03970 [Candidatus Sedimenticola endophacoides]OQX43747.1 MAG: hypothetical protein B0D88_03850 [Candidatus Sedimenticola endophacoides]OQX43973.1 MAG: hypothetical protein B0D86_06620 [Candidatus Sedimenticola endophacoides]
MPAERLSGILNLAAGALLISFAPVFVRLAGVGPITAGVYRGLFGALALFVIALTIQRRFRPGTGTLLWTGLAGLVFAGDLSVWHQSILSVGPGLATVLANFQVFAMMLAAVLLFGERVGGRHLVSAVIALAGLALLVGPGWGELGVQWQRGVLFGLATALFYAWYMLVLRRIQRGQGLGTQVWQIALTSLWTCLFLLAETPLMGESLRIPDGTSLGYLVAYGVLCQGLGWLFISRGLPRVGVSLAGLIILLQPSLAFCWDVLLFGRPASGTDLAGLALALLGIYLGSTAGGRR